QLLPVAFFFQEPLHDLELHRQLADLHLHALELALGLRRVPALEPVHRALEEEPTPALELVHRHLNLPRYCPRAPRPSRAAARSPSSPAHPTARVAPRPSAAPLPPSPSPPPDHPSPGSFPI